MSATAEDVSAAASDNSPSLEQVDEIAELLAGEPDPKKDEADGEETPTDALDQDEDEESDESEAEDGEETDLEAVADDGLSWEGVLGAEEGQLSFDEDGNLTGFVSKVNGEAETVDAKTLIAGYQNNKANTMKSQEHAEKVKAFEVQKEQVVQVYKQKLESVDALTSYFEKQLIGEFDGINWEALRASDPAEWAAKKTEFAEKAGELQRIQQAIATDKQSLTKEQLGAQNEKRASYMKQQYEQMIQNNPEWSDKAVREKARDSFKTFVNETYGFQDSEFDQVFDARLVELIKDAKKYRDGVQIASKKRTKPVPKFQKAGGGRQKPKVSKLEKLTAKARKATGSAKRRAQTDAVTELLLGET